MLLFLALLVPAIVDSTSFMQSGISHELAQYRAEHITHVRYNLQLNVTVKETAVGHVAIQFYQRSDGDVILDFRGPGLAHATVNGTATSALTVNNAHIRIPARLVHKGENTVTFDFSTRIAPSGASIIRFHDTSDSADYLYTLLVPADANQLFPCFDQPDLKANVSLALTVPSTWTAVANGPLVSADTSPQDVTMHFATTKPISTYLIAFAAGPWVRHTQVIDNDTLSMYVRRSRAKEANADALIATNARAMHWLANYFGISFPFSKLDFVLAPAFPFGGMEHPGAVFYNEDQFIFRETPTNAQLIAREETIYHEVAHQWFGDLVTMQWFDDLWLKEGVATYMAAKMQAALTPGADAWKIFYLHNKPAAYAVDLTEGTTAIWQPLANLDQAKSNYGPIVYNKAPGVLKQLNYLVGDVAFRQGVHTFLTDHAYGNATWHDLLDAIGLAAHRSLSDWGQQYILRPGMPMIEQSITVRNGHITAVTLHQHPANAISGSTVWPIRTEVLVYAERTPPIRIPIEMHSAQVQVPLPTSPATPAFVFANANDYAYASIGLDTGSVTWLTAHIGDIDNTLLRAMAWGSLWDRVRNAKLAPMQFLAIAQHALPHERDEESTISILSHVVRAINAYLSPTQRDVILPKFETLLQQSVNDTTQSYGLRKAHLNALIDIARTPTMQAYLNSLLDSTSVAGEPLREPTRWAIVTYLLERSDPTADQRFANEVERDSTSDGHRRAFIAGAARPRADVKRGYFVRYFNDSTLNEDWVMESLRTFNTLDAQTLTLPYLSTALDTLSWLQQHRRIFFLSAWLNAFLHGQTSVAAKTHVHDFLNTHTDLPLDLRQKVLQAADELNRTVAIRQKFAGEHRVSEHQ